MSNTYNINSKVTLPVNQSTYSGTITTSGYNGTSWSSPNWNSSNHRPVLTIPNGEEKVVLEPQATLEVKGKVVINGLDLDERLKIIERLLMIPERDAIMESKYPSLKKKFDEYIKDLEKYRMWESIKGE